MATIALTRPVPPHRATSSITSIALDMDLDSQSQQSASQQTQQTQQTQQPPAPIPNKHVPICPPGPPPADPPTAELPLSPSLPVPPDIDVAPQQSLLFPPDSYAHSQRGRLALYSIDAAGVAAALDYIARQPLPDPALVFPWFHGLHPGNYMQQAFFAQRRRTLRRTPCCLRGVTVVKADGQLTRARLKGAIAPDEFMHSGPTAEFVEADPKEGFSVRNFQIQAAKMAMTSDIIVYGESEAEAAAVRQLGWDIAAAQRRWKDRHDHDGDPLPEYNTFVCTADFSTFEKRHPEIVAVDGAGRLTGQVVDFSHQERREMYALTKASAIASNVWLGPTPEPHSADEKPYDVLIECSDLGTLDAAPLRSLVDGRRPFPSASCTPVRLTFPSSGLVPPPTWSHNDADAILETCRGIHALAGADHKILIHCADGYTESTMLAIAYFSYSTGRTVPEAWLDLHTKMRRNFFAYPSDVALLSALAPRLLRESPVSVALADRDDQLGRRTLSARLQDEPAWFGALDGSFPSRVLDYMYLGNLSHANTPSLLQALGITQILSVGEMPVWRDSEREAWGADNVCTVQGIQDNGIDPLTEEFGRCLEFIDRGRRLGTATLVHCRVGVSRSATICIAEVMRALQLSFPRAYCFVRARRLNVIIQPHLLFAYELLKWEEMQQQQRQPDAGFKRELEWGDIAREVALMNQPYVR